MSLSRDLDNLYYELLTAKSHAYRFDVSSLKLLHRYISNK